MSKSLNIALVVDLDGTLIESDLLEESCFAFLIKNPLRIFKLLKWLIHGKANLKQNIAKHIDINASTLPYNQQVVSLIKVEREKGRKIILATASHMRYAKKIGAHLKCFDQIFATEGNINLSAHNKSTKLVEKLGEKKFDYVGNSNDDLEIWKKARYAYLVDPNKNVLRKAVSYHNIKKIIYTPKKNSLKTWIKAIRLHQWAKNLLIFVPLLASHKINDPQLFFNGILAFIFFGLCASHVYLFNDLIDINHDRKHPNKRFRPLASGLITTSSALIISVILIVISFAGALYTLPINFSLALLIYYCLTFIYSTILKRLIIIDVIALAALYTMRIVAGIFAFQSEFTFWILAFSMFIFLSLALVKRYAELYQHRQQKQQHSLHGRGYCTNDLEMISSLGASAGYLAIMVLALYIQDKNVANLYSNPQIIWLACPIMLYWVSRIWLLTHRGQMHDDPLVFTIKDPASWLVGIILGIIFLCAI
jgi:4-hydroxybenzoate polyprenyltransferase